MKVNFNLSRLHEEVLDECKNFMAAMQGSVPIFAGKVQEWLAEGSRRKLTMEASWKTSRKTSVLRN